MEGAAQLPTLAVQNPDAAGRFAGKGRQEASDSSHGRCRRLSRLQDGLSTGRRRAEEELVVVATGQRQEATLVVRAAQQRRVGGNRIGIDLGIEP